MLAAGKGIRGDRAVLARDGRARRLGEAALEAAAEYGYQHATVQGIVERSGMSRTAFYHRFANRRDAFALAHEAESERLARRLGELAARERGEDGRLRAALLELFRFCEERPLLARGFFVEAYGAGSEAAAGVSRLKATLARVIACCPGLAGPLQPAAVGAIEAVLRTELGAARSGAPSAAVEGLAELLSGYARASDHDRAPAAESPRARFAA